jgi:hypothetical protein
MIEVFIMVAVVSGGAIALRRLATRGSEREGDEIWTTAARRLNGEVELTARGWTRPAQRRIRLTVEGIPMLVHGYRVLAGGDSHFHSTRVAAGPLPAARATRIHCSKRSLVRKMSKHLGIDELPTGHAAFDEVVHVSGSPQSLVRAFLDGPTRLLVADSEAGFDLQDAQLTVEREGVPLETEPLVAMTRFAERLVQRWCALMRGPARLAEHLGFAVAETSDGDEVTDLVASGIHRSRTTRLSVRADDAIVLSVLSFDDARAGEWTMERDESDAFTTAGAPPEAVRAFASVASPSLLGMRAVAGTIELAFDGLAPDHAEVVAALDAMMDATTPLTPYR